MGDEVQAIKQGCSKLPTSSSSARPTDRAPSGRPPAPRDVGRGTVRRRRVTGHGPTATRQPEVLLATATTGEGVPELLAALDARRQAADGDVARERPAG